MENQKYEYKEVTVCFKNGETMTFPNVNIDSVNKDYITFKTTNFSSINGGESDVTFFYDKISGIIKTHWMDVGKNSEKPTEEQIRQQLYKANRENNVGYEDESIKSHLRGVIETLEWVLGLKTDLHII